MEERELKELMGKFSALKITVIGDLFLDRWWEVNRKLQEPSVETGLWAHQVTGRRMSAGAAGTVLNNLSALGVGIVRVISAIGDDGEGYELRRLLEKQKIDMSALVCDSRIVTPAYTKPMFYVPGGEEQEGERFDIKNTSPMPEDIEGRLAESMNQAAEDSDALIVLDQLTEENRGVVTSFIRGKLEELGHQKPELLIFADSRAFADRFRAVTMKCNDQEARTIMGIRQDGFSLETMKGCLKAMEERTGKTAVITCGSRGILVEEQGKVFLVPALPITGPMDVCGCGDVSTSALVSAWCAGADWRKAAQFANLCAAVTIRKIGQTGTSSPEEILERFRKSQEEKYEDSLVF